MATSIATLKALFPNASADFLAENATLGYPKKTPATGISAQKNHDHHTDPRLPNSIPQSNAPSALGTVAERKAQGDGRAIVRFTGYRVRPLDPDNFAGSVKDLLDGLRHAGYVSGDEPWKIILQTDQVKVKSYKEERTVIEIIIP